MFEQLSETSKKIYLALIIGLLSFGVVNLLRITGLLQSIETVLLDQKFRFETREDTAKKVVILAIDQNSMNQFAEDLNIYWPWPREFHGLAVDYLINDGAKVIAFDILFDRPDFDRIDTDGEGSDNRLAEAVSRSKGVILAAQSTTDSSVVLDRPLDPRHILPVVSPGDAIAGFSSLPIEKFMDSANRLGLTNMITDPDGVIRKVKFTEPLNDGSAIPGLAFAAYLAGLEGEANIAYGPDYIQVNDLKIPLDEQGHYLINWYKKGGVENGTFDYIPFFQVMRSSFIARRDSNAARPIPKGFFKDKYVFLGASALGLSDTRSTPFSAIEPFPGVEIHATVTANLLDRVFINEMPTHWLLLLLLAFLLSITIMVFFLKPSQSALGGAVLLVIVSWAGFLVFGQQRFWFPTGIFTVGGLVAFFPALVYRYYSEERQKKEIRNAFSRYVQKEVVQQLMANPKKLRLGGEKKKLTVMFSDLAGFTTISEAMPPENLVELLNAYLGEMTDILFQHQGTLDKYIGDAVMAFWGAPIDQPEQEMLCVKTVLAMNKRLEVLREEWIKQGLPRVFARYGMNTGPAIAGNMGSSTRFNYTVMGDTVNLAARLEPANKVYETEIMMAETTWQAVKDQVVSRQLDKMIVKGKTKPVGVYELIDLNENVPSDAQVRKVLSHYNKGLELYYDRQWLAATLELSKATEIRPDDGPSRLYISRAQHYMRNEPGKDWDGVFAMTSK
jgi:adenylate cyclase